MSKFSHHADDDDADGAMTIPQCFRRYTLSNEAIVSLLFYFAPFSSEGEFFKESICFSKTKFFPISADPITKEF